MIATRSLRARSRSLCVIAMLSGLVAALAGATPAFAEQAPSIPHWKLESRSAPTNLPLESEGMIVVTAANIGDADVKAESRHVTITDTLPAGLEVIHIEPFSGGTERSGKNFAEGALTCAETKETDGPTTITCTFDKYLPTFEELDIRIRVKTGDKAEEPESQVSVKGGETPAGGEAASASLGRRIKINNDGTSWGVEQFELTPENEKFEPDTQAGSHPFQLTTTFDLTETFETEPGDTYKLPWAPALSKNLNFNFPPGLIGDANVLDNKNAVQQCEDVTFGALESGAINSCPADTAIGVATVVINDPGDYKFTTLSVPVFNLPPAPGEPARFGFAVYHVPVVLDTSLRTGGDYGVTVSVHNTSEAIQVLASRVTVWGVPGDPRHEQARGWECLGEGSWETSGSGKTCPNLGTFTQPFLTLPTSCGALKTTVNGESWYGTETPKRKEAKREPAEGFPNSGEEEPEAPPTVLRECESLGFGPSIRAFPVEDHGQGETAEEEREEEEGREPSSAVTTANTPTGMRVHVHFPFEENGRSESAAKTSTVVLPPGVLLSPSAANGLEACSEELAGFTGIKNLEPEATETPTFTPGLPEQWEHEQSPGIDFCASAAKVGTVRITTPDLPRRLLPDGELSKPEVAGSVYLAAQNANPFGSLFAMYVVAQEKESGVIVKLAGEVQLNSETGQITSTFKNTPDVTVENLTLELMGGERASVTTPPSCGPATTNASFTPWSGTGTVPGSSTFNITSGQGGSACSEPLPFEPSLKAGSTNNQAGAFTPFAVTINRPDADQALTSVSMTLPEGLAGELSSVTLCPEPQASQGTCGPESLIGHATASAGLGNEPFTQTGGQVFITGPYDRAPFGLSIVVPTEAGTGCPSHCTFNFGNVVTRSTININENTAALTINSTLPTMLNTASYSTGVPAQLKQVHVTVDRPNFQFNPTNCSAMSITGELEGAQGGKEGVSKPFQVSNCGSLPFGPTLTAEAGGHGSKTNGTNLNVTVTSKGLGQANIAKVDLTLPAALPSRLTTIQKACLASVFEANPAACDEGSVIGFATIHTPVLKNPLSGPAYLVSHGGAAFPDVEFVLQGENIKIVLDGKTDIKHGITYSKFESAPDAPFTTFETSLPAGPHSALTANVPEKEDFSLCKTSLSMPTVITAQNGAVIEQDTKIKVAGCSGVKSFKATRAELLAKALKACKKDKKKSKRLKCEKQARKKYGAKKASKKKKKKKK